jgi:hypothetical protein
MSAMGVMTTNCKPIGAPATTRGRRRIYLRYCSPLTCSIQSTTLPSFFS